MYSWAVDNEDDEVGEEKYGHGGEESHHIPDRCK